MSRTILVRLLQLPLIVGVVYTITLVLAWAIPGNPLDHNDSRRPAPEIVEAMQRQYNLDSLGSFYVSYLANATGIRYVSDRLAGRPIHAGRAVFDFGPSLQYADWRVNEIIASSLPVSVALGGAAVVLALLIGVGAGVAGAVRPGSVVDHATTLVALVGISLPTFLVGTVLLLVFTVWIPLFPVAQWGLRGAVLPAVTLSLPFAAYIARLTRMGMIEALASDYVRTARAKGLSETRVVLGHALPNAFLPVLSFLGPATAGAMTGSFVVEKVFSVPGLGQHFVNAVLNKDLFLIIGVVLVYATMLVVFNLIVDVLYRWVDPRIA